MDENVSLFDGSKDELIALFDGSIEGFMCVIFSIYYDKIEYVDIVDDDSQQMLGVMVKFIEVDYEMADRVIKGIKTKISANALSCITSCFLSSSKDRFLSLSKYIRLGFKLGPKVDLFLQDNDVAKVKRLAQRTDGEAHKLTGFCRFSHLATDIWYCRITPDNNVLQILAQHFMDRLGSQRWVIHDAKRGLAAIYDGKGCGIFDAPRGAHPNVSSGHANDSGLELSKEEEAFQNLWQMFFDTIAIEERKSCKRQRGMLPLRYRGNMTEFGGGW
jgi:probable DNA metabolism protein